MTDDGFFMIDRGRGQEVRSGPRRQQLLRADRQHGGRGDLRSEDGFVGILLILGAGARLVPLGLIALSRSRPSPARPVHRFSTWTSSPSSRPSAANPMFADGRAMRPRPAGDRGPRGSRRWPNRGAERSGMSRGHGRTAERAAMPRAMRPPTIASCRASRRQADGKMGYVTQIPVPVTMDLMRRGQERFNIYCAPCHGLSGYGDGMVARRAAEMQAAGADDGRRLGRADQLSHRRAPRPAGRQPLQHDHQRHPHHAGLRRADFRARPLGDRGLREGPPAEPERQAGRRAGNRARKQWPAANSRHAAVTGGC